MIMFRAKQRNHGFFLKRILQSVKGCRQIIQRENLDGKPTVVVSQKAADHFPVSFRNPLNADVIHAFTDPMEMDHGAF